MPSGNPEGRYEELEDGARGSCSLRPGTVLGFVFPLWRSSAYGQIEEVRPHERRDRGAGPRGRVHVRRGKDEDGRWTHGCGVLSLPRLPNLQRRAHLSVRRLPRRASGVVAGRAERLPFLRDGGEIILPRLRNAALLRGREATGGGVRAGWNLRRSRCLRTRGTQLGFPADPLVRHSC